jgi:hypothetical protein
VATVSVYLLLGTGEEIVQVSAETLPLTPIKP